MLKNINRIPRTHDDNVTMTDPCHHKPIACNAFRPFLQQFRVLLLCLLGFFLGAIVFVGGYVFQRWQDFTAPGPLLQRTAVDITSGMGLREISHLLQQQNVIADQQWFRWFGQWQGAAQQLRAGHYVFSAGISAQVVLETLQRGNTHLYPVTIGEGATSQQIEAILNEHPHFTGAEIRDLPEASLLPETYHFEKGITRSVALQRMQQAWQHSLVGLWEARAPNLPLEDLQQAIILSSIVEREAVKADELSIIAGVFHNRLRRGMRLQSDPTVIYALTEGAGWLNRRLLRKDWRYPHPYNTYRIDGLPPGPIGHPSLAALKAVLHPMEHDYLFFVADGTGGHRFARSYAEHQRNVMQWRAWQREQQ